MWRLWIKAHARRWRWGITLALGTLSREDAKDVFLAVSPIAGWDALLTLCVDDVLDQARERYDVSDPRLLPLLDDAVIHVGKKWNGGHDELFEAREWVIEELWASANSLGIPMPQIEPVE